MAGSEHQPLGLMNEDRRPLGSQTFPNQPAEAQSSQWEYQLLIWVLKLFQGPGVKTPTLETL